MKSREVGKSVVHMQTTDLRAAEPKEIPLPPYLYYGTGTDFYPPREGEDIYPDCGNMAVHLYDSVMAAVCVGATKGTPVVYLVNSAKMAEDGYVFHHFAGRLWMTEKVPAEYFVVMKRE